MSDDTELIAMALIDYTDPDTIARQNIAPNAGCNIDGKFYDVRNLVHLTSSQADRIEALTKERDEADDLAKAAFADGASNNSRLAETSYRVKWLEAKLAKAVEALENLADCVDLGCFCSEMQMATAMDQARATLATLKGDKP
jgi:hypothetical protein